MTLNKQTTAPDLIADFLLLMIVGPPLALLIAMLPPKSDAAGICCSPAQNLEALERRAVTLTEEVDGQAAQLTLLLDDLASRNVAHEGLVTKKADLAAQVVDAETRVTDLLAEIDRAKQHRKLAEIGIGAGGNAAAPTVSSTTKTPFLVALRRGRVSLVDDTYFSWKRTNTTGRAVNVATPKHQGDTVESALAPTHALAKKLKELRASKSYVAILVGGDNASVESFYALARAVRERGLQVGWFPQASSDGKLRFSASGRSVGVVD